LVAAGFTELVINHAHLGQQIEQSLGNGSQWGANIVYSPEPEGALETAGGIVQALSLLGKEPFLVINGDIANDFPYASLKTTAIELAHLVLVPNPPHHPNGDFALSDNGKLSVEGDNKLTFSGIGVYHPSLFKDVPPGKSKLAPLLRAAMANGHVTGQAFNGYWLDVGTPDRLLELATWYQQQTTTEVALS
jgi:N-acetyl-alpha-D-muramate 1-phosphate uridylyltransferase